MSCESEDFLALAKEWNKGEAKSEVLLRSVASRAYYGALHCAARTFPERDGYIPRDKESSHQLIIGKAAVYGKQNNPGRAEAANVALNLSKMRRLRNMADYHLEEEFSRQDADWMLDKSDQVTADCAYVLKRAAQQA